MGSLLEYDIVREAVARLQCKIHDKAGPGSCVFLKMSTLVTRAGADRRMRSVVL